MAPRRQPKRQPGAKPGDQGGEKRQKPITNYLNKNGGDGVKKTTAKNNTISGRRYPTRGSNPVQAGPSRDNNGAALQKLFDGAKRKAGKIQEKKAGNASQDGSTGIQVSPKADILNGSQIQKIFDDVLRKSSKIQEKKASIASQDGSSSAKVSPKAETFDGSKIQDYWMKVPEDQDEQAVEFGALLDKHKQFERERGILAGTLDILETWEREVSEFTGPEALVDGLLNFIQKSYVRSRSDERRPFQGGDPLEGVEATFPSPDGRDSGGVATRKPLYLLDKVINHPDGLVQERARQGHIELGDDAAIHVDRLYPGIRGEREAELGLVDPHFFDLQHDATPANYLASIHNLYLDLRTRSWLHRDDLISGLRLVLLGRDDVFLSPFDLGVEEGVGGSFSGPEAYDWGQRRFHVALFIHNRNHFAVIIGDKEKKESLYYNMMDSSGAIPSSIQDKYDGFLSSIGAPAITLSRGKGPRQLDSYSCGLLVLEAVRHVFREHGGDIGAAGQRAFSAAPSVTDTLGEEKLAAAGESRTVVATLRRAWLLWLEKELGGDGKRRVMEWAAITTLPGSDGPSDDESPSDDGDLDLDDDDSLTRPARKPGPYEKGIRVGKNKLPEFGNYPMFTSIPRDVFEHWLASSDFRQSLDDDQFRKQGFLTRAENDQRLEDLATSAKQWFRLHSVEGLSSNTHDPDLPSFHICCSLTGWHLAGIRGPFSVSADANLPYAFYDNKLSRHTPANVFPIAQCTNWAKGSGFSYAELAAAAGLDRTINNLDTEWEERKPRINWSLNALDNIAAAKTADPCHDASINLTTRCEHLKGQDEDELRQSARFRACPTNNNNRIRGLVDRAEQSKRPGVFFSFGLENNLKTESGEAHSPQRRVESEELHKEIWDAARAEGLSDAEVKHYFLHHDVYFPFHISYRKKYLKDESHWGVAQLYALARDEVASGIVCCNDAAQKKGLGEPDLEKKENWARVIFPIFLESLANLKRAKEKVIGGRRCRAEVRGTTYQHVSDMDAAFMDEVSYLLGDDEGRPISPVRGSILRCVHEKLFDPRDAMLSGNQQGPNGERFVPPFTHGENFHLRRSFRMDGRTVRFSACLTNMVRGQEDSSFWPLSRELLRSIPPDAALSMLDPSLGEKPWVAAEPDDEEFRGVPPPPTFTIDFPRLPVDDVIDQPFDNEGNAQMVRLSCPHPACHMHHQDLPPGELLHHFLKEHSRLPHRCGHCELTFFTPEALGFHKTLCLPRQLGDAYKHFQEYGHHVDDIDDEVDCPYAPGKKRCYTNRDIRMHVKTCGKSGEELLTGQFFCICGLSHSHQEGSVRRHQKSQVHEKQMEFERGEIPAKDVCPECGTLLGAAKDTNQCHKDNCELRKEMRADADAFQQKYKCTIMPDGAAQAHIQKQELALFKRLAVKSENKQSATQLINIIKNHPPPNSLPTSNQKGRVVCDTCLKTFPSTGNFNRHLGFGYQEGFGYHEGAKKLLLYFKDPEAGDPETGDEFRELCRRLQDTYHGHDPTMVSNVLRRMYSVSISRQISLGEFRSLAQTHLQVLSSGAKKRKGGTVLDRIKAVHPETKFGAVDCVDCYEIALFQSPNHAASSPHWYQEGHRKNAGFIDGMLSYMGLEDNKDNRVKALFKVQKMYLDSEASAPTSASSGSGDDAPPPKKRQKTQKKPSSRTKSNKGQKVPQRYDEDEDDEDEDDEDEDDEGEGGDDDEFVP